MNNMLLTAAFLPVVVADVLKTTKAPMPFL